MFSWRLHAFQCVCWRPPPFNVFVGGLPPFRCGLFSMDAALDVAAACRWMHFCLAMIHGQPHLCASGDPEMCASMLEQEQLFCLGDPRICSHDDFVEVCGGAWRTRRSSPSPSMQQRGQLGHRSPGSDPQAAPHGEPSVFMPTASSGAKSWSWSRP